MTFQSKPSFSSIGIFIFMLISIALSSNANVLYEETFTLSADNTRCEYRNNPLGIDTTKPRLSWIINSNRRGEKQTAYQILVASSSGRLEKNEGDLWDSGKVMSDQSIQVEYLGKPLASRMECHWKVRIWDKDRKESPWSKPALWTMGLLHEKDWNAAWIGLDQASSPSIKEETDARSLPARYLRSEFNAGKKVTRATAYICGLGFFELYLNGEKVSNSVMNPALSDYRKAVYYLALDITTQIKNGKNAIGVILGNGRYFAPRLHTPAPTVTYGYPKLLFQTEIQYDDGTSEKISSDENWKLTTDGPIRANNEYDGEIYDARMEMNGWNTVGFDDSKWQKAQIVNAPGGRMQSQIIEPMRITQTIKPVSITCPKPGIYIVDMGQAFYGTFRMKASGVCGKTVSVTSAYSLLPDGTLKTADNRGARVNDIYTFKGQGQEVWSPTFTGQGYRRLQIKGFTGSPTIDNFEGLVIHTDVESAGNFECSNDLINRIHSAMRWGFRMFLRSAPLDPDRDERQPWLGDSSKNAESEAYNFNVAAFYTKFMDDISRSQRPDGTITDVSLNWEWGNGVEWA